MEKRKPKNFKVTVKQFGQMVEEVVNKSASQALKAWQSAHAPTTEKVDVSLTGCSGGDVAHEVFKHTYYVPAAHAEHNGGDEIFIGIPKKSGPPHMQKKVEYYCRKCLCLLPTFLCEPGSDIPTAKPKWFIEPWR